MSNRSCGKYSFSKYQGAGNDFILIDDRALSFPAENREQIRIFCHRKWGIGADGLLLLQEDRLADFRMRIFNADGGEAASCGNGLRCLLRFLLDLGLAPKNYRIAVGDRVVTSEYRGESIFLEMGPPRHLQLGLHLDSWEVHAVDTGVPHAVIFVPDAEVIDLGKLAPSLRHHLAFHPRGANVNFAHLSGDHRIRLRTFERGIEGETLACGTGAGAVAVIARALYGMRGPIQIDCSGGCLEAQWDGGDSLQVGGPAQQIFSGTILADLN